MSDSEIRKYHEPKTRGTWVQTERAAHDAWAALIHEHPRAAQLLHILVANMDKRGALIASHDTLAKLTGVSVATIKRSLTVLVKRAWVQTIRVGSARGGALAYVVNSRIAWADDRHNLKYATFQAKVIVSSEEEPDLEQGPPLIGMPALEDDEEQLPVGPGLPPPKQELIEATVPDLPFLPRH